MKRQKISGRNDMININIKLRDGSVKKDYRKAFTLVELLVVVSIIALLLAVLMPALGAARRQAQQVMCMAYEKQIMNVHLVYVADSQGWIIAGSQSPGVTWCTVFHDKYKLEYKFFICPGDKVQRVGPTENPIILSGYGNGATSLPIYPRSYTFNPFINGGNPAGTEFTNAWIANTDHFSRMNPSVPMKVLKGRLFPDYGDNGGFPCKMVNVQKPAETAIHDEYSDKYCTADWTWCWEQMFTPAQMKDGVDMLPHKGATNIAFLDSHIEKLTLKERNAAPKGTTKNPGKYVQNEGSLLWVRKVYVQE